MIKVDLGAVPGDGIEADGESVEITGEGSEKLDFAKEIIVITEKIKFLTEQIRVSDNKGGDYSILLGETIKKLEELKKSMEELEWVAINKRSEGSNFSNCCG